MNELHQKRPQNQDWPKWSIVVLFQGLGHNFFILDHVLWFRSATLTSPHFRENACSTYPVPILPLLFVCESGRPAVRWLTREPFAGVATAAGCCYGEELEGERGGEGVCSSCWRTLSVWSGWGASTIWGEVNNQHCLGRCNLYWWYYHGTSMSKMGWILD